MKLITKETDYAVRALEFMAKRTDSVTSVSELVKELKLHRPFLRKILQILNKKRILKSYKGRGGGFLLAVPPNRIFLVDLIEIFQGSLQLNECLFRKRVCPNALTCVLKKRIEYIEKWMVSEFSSIDIASLLK